MSMPIGVSDHHPHPKIVAMIPVRKGSQRIESKNTRHFAGTTLLDLKLEVLSGVEGLSDVIVSTDCAECMAIASNHGVVVQKRDSYFAGSTISNDAHWRHIAETTPGDVVLLAQVTSPFVKRSTYSNALRQYRECLDLYDSLNSVTLEKKFLWQDGKPINYDVGETPKSQNLPDIVSLNFAMTIISRPLMIRRGNVIGERPQFITLDKIESIDIDDTTDFIIAEALLKHLGKSWLLE